MFALFSSRPGAAAHRFAGLVAAVAAAAWAAGAEAETAPFMALGEPAPAPIAFLSFCTRLPAECAPATAGEAAALSDPDLAARTSGPALVVGALGPEASEPAGPRVEAAPAPAPGGLRPAPASGRPAPLAWTGALERELDGVNRRINAAIRPESDLQSQGVADRWDLPLEEGLKVGDCEDYVLEKRRALIADGVPAEDLSIAIALTRWGEAHAVLLVLTDRGEMVLDSLSPWTAPWKALDYRWIERQAPGRTFDWVSIAS
jgi:predicted transglutaminase-like cysteine proteinase